MSAVVAIDLSSRALDLVKLDETSSRAEWVHVELAGKDAWERTLGIRNALAEYGEHFRIFRDESWWDDVYLVAIEAPYGRGQAGTQAVLNRVVGAVAASLPARLRDPGMCWIVRPDEWKNGLGLKAKPDVEDIARVTGGDWELHGPPGIYLDDPIAQNGRDALAIALWARNTHAEATQQRRLA